MRFAFLFLMFATPAVAQPESTDTIIEKLRQTDDGALVTELARRSTDPRVIPALRDAFARAKVKGAKDGMGWPAARGIAAVLVQLGVKDDLYFDEVASYAKAAIGANPPVKFVVDKEGRQDTNQISPAFKDWCEHLGLDNTSCSKTSADLGMDLVFFSGVRDPRAIPILREGLKMSGDSMVALTVTGLARLNDKDSIPAIASACERFPRFQAENIAIHAMEFADAGVQLLFAHCIRDSAQLDSVKKEWQEKHPTAAGGDQ